jgi:hypothetical protein
MTDISRLIPALPRDLDGFHVESRPLNVISMLHSAREQLRVAG